MSRLYNTIQKRISKLRLWAKINPYKRNITYIVVTTHLILITIMTCSLTTSRSIPRTKPLIVKTVKLQSKIITTQQKPHSKHATASKTVNKKPTPIKKNIPKPVQHHKNTVRHNELLDQLKETIEKIDQTSHSISRTQITAIPKAIEQLHVDTKSYNNEIWSSDISDTPYRDVLINRLRTSLKLPEFGEVKIILTIRRDGNVRNMSIVNTESITNKNYVEKVLPLFVFPPFGMFFKGEDSRTFSIVLSNDI